jgi:hypothetical protein
VRFRDKLQSEDNAACCFVSAHSATPLDLLCARAGHAPSFERFLDVFVGDEGDAKTLGKDFEQPGAMNGRSKPSSPGSGFARGSS